MAKSCNYSVLMSVYKKENPEFLKLSIESILNQTIKTNDFVIVEDGPLTVELDELLDYYRSNNECIHTYKLENNVGLGVALNYGLNKCLNELVARMDSDDISELDRCEKQINAFKADDELVIVGTDLYEFTNDPYAPTCYKMQPHTPEEIYEYGKRKNPFNHPTVMYKKSKILEKGGYSPFRRSQDIELFNRIVGGKAKCMNIKEPLLRYRKNENASQRRKSWESVSRIITVIFHSYKRGYSSLFDYIYVLISEMAIFVLPRKCVDFIYKNFYRKNINT